MSLRIIIPHYGYIFNTVQHYNFHIAIFKSKKYGKLRFSQFPLILLRQLHIYTESAVTAMCGYFSADKLGKLLCNGESKTGISLCT